MEPDFAIARGFLSEAASQLDPDSAAFLATGHHGWYKARQRSDVLVEMIRATGGHLTPSSSFDMGRYLAARNAGEFRGIVLVNQTLQPVTLSKASTAAIGDPGLNCLRALTTALLSIFTDETTTAVLIHIIPSCVSNRDQGDLRMPTVGPLKAAIQQFTKAVADEENCNTVIKKIHSQIDADYFNMFSDTKKFAGFENKSEILQVIGLIKWVLSPSERARSCYFTRSLSAWSLASALRALGFDVHTSTVLIDSQALYDQAAATADSQKPSVHLVIYNDLAGETDIMAPSTGYIQIRYPPFSHRIVPIKNIPTVIFRHIVYEDVGISVPELCEIWNDTFEHACSTIGPLRLIFPSIEKGLPCNDFQTSHEAAIEPIVHIDCSPYNRINRPVAISTILLPQLKKHIPVIKWTLEVFGSLVRIWDTDSRHFNDLCVSSENPALWSKKDEYVCTAIFLASTYAICSKAFCVTKVTAPLVEVAVYPDLLTDQSYSNKLSVMMRLFTKARRAVGIKVENETPIEGVSYERWTSFVYDLCTSTSSPRKDPSFAYYTNGIFIAMHMLVHPSLSPRSLVQFHVGYGQPLQIPISQSGAVELSHPKVPGGWYFNPKDAPDVLVLQSQRADRKVSIHVEPNWEVDPRKIIFRASIDGVEKLEFNPGYIMSQFGINGGEHATSHLQFINCTCGNNSVEVVIDQSEHWKQIEISHILDSWQSPYTNYLTERMFKLDAIESGAKRFVPLTADPVAQLLYCTIVGMSFKVVATECMKCAYDALRVLTYRSELPQCNTRTMENVIALFTSD